jgi:DNA-binding protein H-NS
MQRAVNPQTGEVLFLVNNQWTPPSQTAKNPKTGQSAYLVNNEWQILDPFKMEQESGEAKTTNPFLGFVGRGAELIGSGVEAVAEVGERLGDKLELAMPLSNLTPEQVKNEQQLKPLFDFAKSLEDFNKNIGYSPSTKLSDLPGNPLKTIPFVAERVITSTPDMAAAFAAAPAYFTARTKEILDERVKNDNKTLDDATIGDVSTAAGAAAFETLFERFAVGRLLPGGGATGKTAPGRIAKETGIQSGTEFAEEFGTYAAETAGTKKGFDLEEASLAGLEGAIVGGGLGATVQTSKEGLDAYRRSKDQTSPDAEPEDPISTTPAGPVDPTLTAPITPTPVLEQEGAIAPAPQIAPVSQPTPIQIYNNPLDEVTAEVIANPDNRFSVRMTDLTTGQTMDGGTFDTADEANARAAQSIGMSIKPIAPVGPVQAPPAATPPTVAPPTVTPPEAAVTPPASAPISQEPVIPTSGFRTEKGSIYSLDEQGRTSRTKVSEGKGKGTTYDPHAALYVTPEDAQSILSDMQSGSIDQSASVRLGYIDLENNVFKTITDTSQLPAGVEPLVGVVDKNKNQLIGSYKAQLTPAVGLSPVEKMYTPDGMSNTHIGNKIVELFGQATPAATPAVEPTVTPETPPEAPPVSTRTAQEVQVDVNRTRQQIRQAKTAVKKGTVGPEFVSPLEAKLEALENELSQVKAAPRKAAPKYRDSKGNTWTGRGLQPAWLKEALGEGRDIDEFAILPQLDNKSQDELVGRSEFPLIVPDARRAEIEQEIEDSLKKIRSLERPTGQDNLFTMLRGKFPKGYFKKNKIDISESLRNRLESDTGRSTLDSVVETGNLDRFFPEDSRIGNLASQRAEGTSRDLSRELDVVKDNVETLINKLESNDPLSEDTNLLMIELDLRIQELEKELQLEDVNQELSEVAIEERRIAQQIEADAIAEQEGTAASFEGQVREPEQPDFELRGQTQKELTDLERKDKTGEAERLRKERETREMVDRERDAFTLQPTTQPPLAKPVAPTGDLFGAKPTREEQAAINRARQAERRKQTAASKQQPKNIYKTTDGYTFFELSDGSIVDNIDPEKVDLSWPSVKEFLSDMDGSAWKFGDEVGLRRAFVKTGLDPDDKKLIEKLNRFDTDFVSITNFYRARREQLISAKRKSEIKLVSSRREAEKGKVREQLKLFEQEPISANEDNRAGQAARRDAVSTVDDLQSTNNPLAMALSKDYAARQRVTLVGQSVKSYDDLAILSQVYRHPSFESVRMFFVNDAGEVVSQLGVTSRLPGSSAAIMGKDGEEYVSKVQTAAQKSGATGVWMLHNHPSGNVTPSNADEILTRLFVQRFNKLDYKGHVIIDTNQYSVISPTGSIINISKDMSQKDLVAYRPETYKQILEPITIAKRVDENPQSMVIIALNNDAKVTGITTIDNDFFKRKTDSQIRRAFYKLAISNFSSRLLVATRDLDALDKVAGMVQDGILIEPNGKFKGLTEIYTRRSKFLFPISRPGVVTTDSSKLFDFLRIPKGKPRGAEYLTWPDIRVLLEKDADQMTFQEPQDDLFGDENKTLHELSENLPKAKKKLPPGRSPELAALAQLLQQGKVTKEEFDAAVNKYRPIPVYEEPLEPATDQQVVNALYSDKQPRANVTVATGTKVGLRLDIPAWNRHKTFVVAIHEKRKSASAVGKSIGYRSVAMVKNVVFTVGNQLKALEIAAGEGKSALQTMEGEYVDVSPADALEMAKKAIKSDRYIQVGFDPIRHSYFFDRRTTLPVLKADAVLQIGNMILARGVEFGKKESFLYNIDAPQSNLFSNQENKVLKQTDDVAPSGKKVVTKNRSPELTAAAQQLSRGEITKEEYEAAVQRFSPVSVYAEPPKPASNAQVVEALDANKKKDANVNIESGTKVGLRLDIPAWENKKTWVVAIHEGKPKITSPKADKILSYRSVAALENVVFGIGNQTKTLAIAAGEFKDKLQTMEGEYVNISPDEAYRRAQEFIKDPAYIQVGFNPLRHAYFYDRRTMLPVVKADEVLQIGNLILAKNATYGTKEDFLFNIDSTPEMTEAEISQGVTDVREEQIAEYARLRAKRERLVQEVIGGANTIDTQRELTNLDNVTKALKEDIDAEYTPSTSPANFLNRALKAFDKGDMSAEVLATIQDAYNKTPFILNGLRLSIRTPKDGTREIGNFNPFERIVTLWNGTRGVEKPSTIRHELTHSLEQMMTAIQRKLLVDAWSKDFEKAVKKNTDDQSRLYFKKVLQFIDNPSQESFAAATAAMPSYEFYQYMSPSEYWAVNAETLMASKLGTAWGRFVTAIKKYLEALKNVFGFNNKYAVHKTFDQLMRDKPTRISTDSLIDFVASTGSRPVTLSNINQNIFGQPMPEASWGRPDDSKIDNVIYTLQDKQIDTKRVVESIKKSGKEIADKWNPYLQEELYHGRTATQTKDFLDKELAPLMKELRDRDLTMEVVEEYLHNRHAKARNEFNAKRDPNMPDGGSGILTADAQAYLDGLDPKQKRNLEAVAKLVDDIVNKTQEVIVSTGQESQETVDAWKKALTNYVPLQREETDYDIKNVGIGVGSGFAVKGPFSRAAVGSSRKVVDILANLAAQRERAIVRGEKMRVAKALYGLVASNPNPGFWLAFDPEAIKNPQEALNDLMSLGLKNDKGEKFSLEDLKSFVSEPMVRRVDAATNQVVLKPNALLKNASTTFPVRINGKEKYIIFNANDPRAARMAKEMKNLDADQLSRILGYTQQITQYFAKINTQYNPIFGVINFARDIQGAILQLSTTPLRYKKKEVLSGVLGALRGIYAEERLRRAGKPPSKDSYAALWREFQEQGGQTGFRDQFSRMQDRADALQAILDPSSWTKSPLGKVFTAGGTLKVPLETARKIAAPVFDWLSDYNQTMENAVRLSAYKVAKEQKKNGVREITDQQAASLAKNLTVNFNRKGQIGRQAGALYAFFNAAVQGTARMLETLRGPAGKTIIGGGLLIGSAQAMLLAAFGFDEDEPPDFVKERNIVIPTGGGKYITVPMPLGYNVIPNTSRILTEWGLSGFKDTHKRVAQITGAALDMFNPIGNAGWSMQTLTPTVGDPLVALTENRDWTGKPIAKEDISNLDPTPGYSRSKETASYISKAMAKFLNFATGGTDYTPGGFSPTPDQIDFLIGQLTGGVGRELLKAEQTVTSQFTGEELPIYKVPLVGRFVGDSEGQAAERNRFYNNIILLNKHEREIKGRQKDRIPTRDYLMEYPEARLYSYANQVERNIRTLRKRRDALIEQDAPKERVKQVENQMTVQMKRFNERVKSAQE